MIRLIISSLIRMSISITMLYYAYIETGGVVTTIILSMVLAESESNTLLRSLKSYQNKIEDKFYNNLNDLLNKKRKG